MTRPVAYARIGEHRVTHATVHVPPIGPWWADVDLEQAPELEGAVTLALGHRQAEIEFVGTVLGAYDGSFGLRRRTRIVAGAGAWQKLVAARSYHNDMRVRARVVVEDLVDEVGEQLGDFAPAAERVGLDYVRQAGPAARALEEVIGGVPWWVDYAGVTHVGQRATEQAAEGTFEVLSHDPRAGVLMLALDEDDLRTVGIGTVLSSDRLDAPQTVRELELDVAPDQVRVRAWCGGVEGQRGRLAAALAAIVDRASDGRLWGLWPYRVVRMSADRVELQAVRQRAGLPDILPISMAPGIAGVHAELTPGTEVLVQFVEGLRTQPVITHFAGKDAGGWAPTALTLEADTITLGSGASDAVALAPKIDAVFAAIRGAATGDAIPSAVNGAFPPESTVAASKVEAK